MPLTPSPRMGLTRPAGSDPFLRQTFVDNMDILDNYPGVRPCTSTTRPTWGAAQAGMLIQETDTGRLVRWTGTAWAVVENYGRVFRASTSPSDDLAKGSATTYTIHSGIEVTRTCVMNVQIAAQILKTAATPQQVDLDPWINGSSCNYGYVARARFADGPSGTTEWNSEIATLLGARTVAPGTYNVQVRCTVGNTFNNTIRAVGFKSMVFLSEG